MYRERGDEKEREREGEREREKERERARENERRRERERESERGRDRRRVPDRIAEQRFAGNLELQAGANREARANSVQSTPPSTAPS